MCKPAQCLQEIQKILWNTRSTGWVEGASQIGKNYGHNATMSVARTKVISEQWKPGRWKLDPCETWPADHKRHYWKSVIRQLCRTFNPGHQWHQAPVIACSQLEDGCDRWLILSRQNTFLIPNAMEQKGIIIKSSFPSLKRYGGSSSRPANFPAPMDNHSTPLPVPLWDKWHLSRIRSCWHRSN